MVNHHTAFLHDFLEMPVTQWIGCVPANADQNHIDRNRILLVFCIVTASRSKAQV